jgi:hypothetical protein
MAAGDGVGLKGSNTQTEVFRVSEPVESAAASNQLKELIDRLRVLGFEPIPMVLTVSERGESLGFYADLKTAENIETNLRRLALGGKNILKIQGGFMLPSCYEEVDRGGLFVMRFEGQGRPEEGDGFVIRISVINQTIEVKWFEEAVKICFSSDRGVVVEGGLLIFTKAEFEHDEIDFLNKRADELMDVLKTHPNWGKVGGPDGLSDYLFVGA